MHIHGYSLISTPLEMRGLYPDYCRWLFRASLFLFAHVLFVVWLLGANVHRQLSVLGPPKKHIWWHYVYKWLFKWHCKIRILPITTLDENTWHRYEIVPQSFSNHHCIKTYWFVHSFLRGSNGGSHDIRRGAFSTSCPRVGSPFDLILDTSSSKCL